VQADRTVTEEADLAPMVLDRLHTDGCRDMTFSSPRAADEHDVFRAVHELPAMQLTDSGFIDVENNNLNFELKRRAQRRPRGSQPALQRTQDRCGEAKLSE
jgi:hypothetical protein